MTNPVNARVIANLKKALEDAQAVASAIEDNAQHTGEGITDEEFEAFRDQLNRINRTVEYARLLVTKKIQPFRFRDLVLLRLDSPMKHRVTLPYRPRRKPPTWRSWAMLGVLLAVLGIALANRAIDEPNKPLPQTHHGQ